jgi:acyl-CoA synthetase (AMP-forming)/AMP-acid ligase II
LGKPGVLYFVCRKDNQINQMAIELREKRLSATCSGTVDEKALLQALPVLVFEYMVPSRLQILAGLPKNPNGKVDRQRLTRFLDT